MKFSKKAKALIVAGFIAVGTATPAQAVDLAGSGASFVDPLLQACKAGFAKASSHSYVYTSTGSGTGQKNSDAKIGAFNSLPCSSRGCTYCSTSKSSS